MPVSVIRNYLDRLGVVDSAWAMVGGGVATLMILMAVAIAGNVSGYSALQLLESTMPSVRFLTSTVATGGVTILALMVTLLGLSHSVDTELEVVHYRRIQQIAYMSAVSVAAAIFLLVFLSVPVEESDDVAIVYAEYVYYGILILTSLLGGVMVTLVLMLLTAVRGLLHVVAPSLEEEPTDDD